MEMAYLSGWGSLPSTHMVDTLREVPPSGIRSPGARVREPARVGEAEPGAFPPPGAAVTAPPGGHGTAFPPTSGSEPLGSHLGFRRCRCQAWCRRGVSLARVCAWGRAGQSRPSAFPVREVLPACGFPRLQEGRSGPRPAQVTKQTRQLRLRRGRTGGIAGRRLP